MLYPSKVTGTAAGVPTALWSANNTPHTVVPPCSSILWPPCAHNMLVSGCTHCDVVNLMLQIRRIGNRSAVALGSLMCEITVRCPTSISVWHLLLHTGLQIPERRQCQEPVDASQHWTPLVRLNKIEQAPRDGDHLSRLVSHWQHSGILGELGLLCYTRWRLWPQSVIVIRCWWCHDHQSLC